MKTHLNCPSCGHKECMTEFDDGNTYCHSCHNVTIPFLKEKGNPPPELTFEIRGYRSIREDVAKKYNILTGMDGEVEYSRVYPYPHDLKTRVLPKNFSYNKGFKNTKLFGMDKFAAGSSKVLVIVEGEDDAPSAYQMLGCKIPVVAAPGNGTLKSVLKDKDTYDWVNSFKTIVAILDKDEAGLKLGNDLSRAFPNRTYAVHLSTFKDSNEYLVNGRANDFANAFMNREKYVPDNILNTSDQFVSLFRDTPEHQYVPTGIEALDEKIKGIMRGYFTVLKARTGIGKTEVMRYLEYSLLRQGTPIAVWHLEETKLRSLLGLTSYHMGDNVTRRDIIEERNLGDQVEEAIREITKDELLYQFFLRDGDTIEDLIEQIRYFSEVCDVKYIFLEPIQDIVTASGESKEQLLAELAVRLSKLCAELNIAVITIAHTNDDGEIKYCRMIGQRAAIVINLERDKESSDEDVRNTTWLTIEKNRPMGLEGHAGCLEFNPDTYVIEEKVF